MYTATAKDWLYIGKANILFVFLFCVFYSLTSFSESGRTDYDLDDDGLIEINDLVDLDEIRNNLNGRSLYSEDIGCPEDGCNGFELTINLDFDTNQNGAIDSNDAYWNDGAGWVPLGDLSVYEARFSAIFSGNNFEIKNLYINRPTSDYVGLFGYLDEAQINELSLNGSLSSVKGKSRVGAMAGGMDRRVEITGSNSYVKVTGDSYVGGLVGYGDSQNEISDSYVNSHISGRENIGGLAGYLKFSNEIRSSYFIGVIESYSGPSGGLVGQLYFSNSVSNSFSSGAIKGASNAGGLIGFAEIANEINDSFSTASVKGTNQVGGLIAGLKEGNRVYRSFSSGFVSGHSYVGGLIGASFDGSDDIRYSYWVIDSSGQSVSADMNETYGYLGLSLAILQCATQANVDSDNSDCVSSDGASEGLSKGVTLYKTWSSSDWDFGSGQQLPALNIQSAIHRDSDGDGVLDGLDNWSNLQAVSIDADLDGYPDAWTIGCDLACQQNTGFTLDQFPSSSAGWQDSDKDGLLDSWAQACNETCQEESGLTLDSSLNDSDNDGILNDNDRDDNGDGIIDIDSNGNGLIEISNLTQLNAIRYQLDGFGFRESQGGILDQTGCPFSVVDGVYQSNCLGYELISDLDFDTNQDGLMNAEDEFWNANDEGVGEGWLPLGKTESSFSAIFSGQGHVINNLYINRSGEYFSGLFGSIRQATITKLGLTGPLTSISGSLYVGSLVGYVTSDNLISEVFSTGSVSGGSYVGGLIGKAVSDNVIKDSFSTASVIGQRYSGGFIGSIYSNNHIRNTFSSGLVNASSQFGTTGGLIAHISDSTNVIENSYWANDISQQTESAGSDELNDTMNSYVGLPLATLQCAIQANVHLGNSDCVSEDGVREGLDSSFILFRNWDESGNWHFGNGLQLPGLNINAEIHRDSDGDGKLDSEDLSPFDSDNDAVINSVDAFPFMAAASIDTDLDGQPNEWNINCDLVCQNESSLELDLDDDNDGIPDIHDGFPLNMAASLDFDDDGLADSWNANCNIQCKEDSGLELDLDDDNDGIADLLDSFPLNNAASLDSDGDGFPNSWRPNCNELCISESGLILDQLPELFSASVDIDFDGIPDQWNTGCDSQCQQESELSLDSYPNDTDNDGVTNDADIDNNRDDGNPDLVRIPNNIAVSVSDDGVQAIMNWDQIFFSQFEGFDAVDGYDVSFEAYLNGSVIEADAAGQVNLPAGYLEIDWVAMDKSGNRSNAKTQIIKVYPQVRFAQIQSVSGDESIAEVVVELSAESPEYPVILNWHLAQELSSDTLDQQDFGNEFHINELQEVIIQAGDDLENLNTHQSLHIPISENDSNEYDEIAILDLVSVVVEEGKENLYSLGEQGSRHTLTIAYQNLAPVVQLVMEHNAREITQVEQNSGLVTVTAIVSDGNDLDEHTLGWDVHELGLDAPEGNVLNFDSSELSEGIYRISIVATDSGENSLSAQVNLDVIVVKPLAEKGESGTGSLWWLSILILGLIVPRCIATKL